MSHKRAKKLRREMRRNGLDATEVEYQAKLDQLAQATTIRITPSTGRKIYQRAKKLTKQQT